MNSRSRKTWAAAGRRASGSPTPCARRAARVVGTSPCTSGAPWPAPRSEVDHGGQRLPVDLDQAGGVLGDVAVVGHDHGDRLADVAHLVHAPAAAGCAVGQARMRDDQRRGLVELAQVGGGQDQVHAGQRARAGDVDRPMPRGRAGCAARGVQHARRIHVVDEAAEPAQQARVFVAGNPRADHARRHGALGASPAAPGVARAGSPVSIRLARRTARTMFW